VNQDGSRRRLGPYREASWSPHGLFVAATRQNELVALDPRGNIRWTLPRRSPRFPTWTGTRTDTRIAYISGGKLHIVAGDGTGDRIVGKAAATFRPEWLPGRKVLFSTGSRLVIYDDGTGSRQTLKNYQHVFDPAIGRRSGQSEVIYHRKIVFRGTGIFGQAVPSPDRRWLLVTWPTADQWVFVRPGTRKIVGVSRISSQFGGFPRVEGWCCSG
jgi:hypothetical protein